MTEGTYIDSDGSELRVYNWGRSGTQFRYYNSQNKLHRLDGPAVICSDSERHWYQNNQLHRLDGPAYEDAKGRKYWFVRGKKVEPLFLVAYWLERGRCCWYDESTQELRFGDD